MTAINMQKTNNTAAPKPVAAEAATDEHGVVGTATLEAGPFAGLPRPRVVMSDDSTVIVTDATTEPDADPADYGYFDAESGDRLTNFTLPLLVEEEVQDGEAVEKFLQFGIHGAADLGAITLPMKDLLRDHALMTAIGNTAGVAAQVYCAPKVLRSAMLQHAAALSFLRRRVTRNFGWDADRTVYRFPAGSIDRDGYHPLQPDDWRVDLSPSKLARRLNLAAPPADLASWKRHLWDELLAVNHRRTTLALLGTVGAAVLFPTLSGYNRFGVWLAGSSGTGKSFTAQLFLNFFGDFPPGKGHVPTWGSTPNFLQAEGYYFKDAIYAIDDYKREVIDSAGAVVRLLQNYADDTARGRLKGRSELDDTRPVRGLLVSTGEAVPDYSASAIARLVVVRVPDGAMNTEQGRRCLQRHQGYPGLLAAFIHHLLAADRMEGFAGRVIDLQDSYRDGVAGLPNSLRVTGNIAVLAAALDEWALFVRDAVPQAPDDVQKFIEEDLVVIRNELLGPGRVRTPEVTFLAVLADLCRADRVHVKDVNRPGQRVVGKRLAETVLAVSLPWSLEEVNKELRQRRQADLSATHRQILDRLRDDGLLCDETGQSLPVTAKVEPKVVRVEGRPTRCFLIRPEALLEA